MPVQTPEFKTSKAEESKTEWCLGSAGQGRRFLFLPIGLRIVGNERGLRFHTCSFGLFSSGFGTATARPLQRCCKMLSLVTSRIVTGH